MRKRTIINHGAQSALTGMISVR
ncbi:hypothetical protein M3J09_007634 [Ascochyta lentis]